MSGVVSDASRLIALHQIGISVSSEPSLEPCSFLLPWRVRPQASSGPRGSWSAPSRSLGLPRIGTLGILLAAKRRELIPAIREPIDTLRHRGFRVAEGLYEDMRQRAGELP